MHRTSQNLNCRILSGLPAQARFAPLGARYRQTLGPVATGDKARCPCGTTAIWRGRQRPCLAEMNPSPAILVCDRDSVFREALRNFLLAAGHSQVEMAATVREALASLRRRTYSYVLIGVCRPFSCGRRLAVIVRRRQREATIFFLVSAQDQPFITDVSCDYVIKEYVFSNLLELM